MINVKKYSLSFFLLVAVGLVALFCGCSNLSKDGTAAKVNDTIITEDQVTQKIIELRAASNLSDEEAWTQYLKQQNLTSSKIREQTLNGMIDLEVYKQIAKEYSITANDDNSLVNQVNDEFIDRAKPSKSSYSELLVAYGDKLNGSKGYYQLMYKNSEENKAALVLNQINSGAITFQDAIKDRLKEDSDGVNFSYVIYDCMIKNPDPCPQVLSELHPGQISNLVKTKDYIYIFNVVDEISCNVPLTDLSDLSSYTQDNLRYYAKIMDAKTIVDDSFKKEKRSFDIVKYDMPQGLPY